jgi:transposase
MHNDDTSMRILRLAREPADTRTGIFTSGIVSLGPGWKIALYFSGAKHAGENLAELLKRRPPGLAPLIQMCDALSWNTSPLPEGVQRLLAHCMSHGRRQFVEVAENFPEECRYVLETLGGIWHHDALAREQRLSALSKRPRELPIRRDGVFDLYWVTPPLTGPRKNGMTFTTASDIHSCSLAESTQ